MADFRTTLARQKAEQTQFVQTSQLRTTQPQYLQAPEMTAPSSSPKTPPPPPAAAFQRQNQVQHRQAFNTLRYPVEHITASNQSLLNANFNHEAIAMNDFQRLDPKNVKLFSDGIYRLVKEENGIVSHVPALVSGN